MWHSPILRILLSMMKKNAVAITTSKTEMAVYARPKSAIVCFGESRSLYDGLKRHEIDMLSQLRTGMARINSYLHRIGAAESDMCTCGQTMMGNLSFFLGGKAASDGPKGHLTYRRCGRRLSSPWTRGLMQTRLYNLLTDHI
jgi:hypothetical protein